MKYQRKDLAQFPNEIRFAVNNYKSAGFDISSFKNIVLGGLGGSGIAGRIAKSYFYSKMTIPVEVISEYDLPAFVSADTLVVLNSYSGNTEETLNMYKDAKERGATIIVLTTGGKLAEIATANGNHIYLAEKGYQPRMTLGYSLSYILLILADLLNEKVDKELLKAADELDNEEEYIDRATKIFEAFKDKPLNKVVAITDVITYPIGIRMEQQIEENSKSQAFVHALPESNHNVIESYYNDMNSFFILLNSHANERVSLRFGFVAELLRGHGNTVVEMNVMPSISGIMQTIYTLDWLSLIMADFKVANSSNIENINALKSFLAEN